MVLGGYDKGAVNGTTSTHKVAEDFKNTQWALKLEEIEVAGTDYETAEYVVPDVTADYIMMP